jgi:UDP-N-acetylglucosamine--N-acetylmuramyl-(pentapeptide) pyrophosphoryl-undecaprenol N-acetylglucosamine transferase
VKVVFVAINGIGLGHLNRTRQIARALRERDPSVDIVFVTNSIKPEFVAQDGFTVLRPFLPFDPTRELRAAWLATSNAVLEAILLAQQPDVIVYDYLYWRGLLARVAKKLAARQVLVLRHRVGKSARRLVKRETRRALVDLLLVPHRKDDFDATGMPAAFVERLAFVGEVAAPRATAAECDAVRDRYGIAKDTRLVVVSPGGGGADECATFFREALTAAVRVARERRDVKIVAISGPLRAPESLASAQDVLTIVPFEPRDDGAHGGRRRDDRARGIQHDAGGPRESHARRARAEARGPRRSGCARPQARAGRARARRRAGRRSARARLARGIR